MSQKQRAAHQLRRRQAKPQASPVTLDLAPLLHEARRLYAGNDLPSAERLLRRLLAHLPHHAESLHLLGVILYRTNRLEEAADCMAESVAGEGSNAAWRSNFGLLLQAQGKLEAAAEQYGHALRLNPRHPEAHNNLGNVLQLQGRLEDAAAHYREALRLKPDYSDAYINLGAVARAQGRIDEAIAHYHRALALKPDDATAHYNLGNALTEGGELDGAVASYQKAIAADPVHTDSHYNLGNTLPNDGEFTDAAAALEGALAVDPASAKAHYNLGNALSAQDKDEEALAEYHRALALDPRSVGAHTNIGVTRQGEGRLAEAIASYRAALAIDPEEPKAHLNMGMAHLIRGEFAAGWPHYEWRHKAVPESAPKEFPQPRWMGPVADPLNGRRILLQPEQGLGDTLEFMRYVPRVREAGGQVILQVQPSLRRLAEESFRDTGAQVIGTDQEPPPFDLRCPMLSLPLAFGTTMETIPAPVAYLRPPAEELHAAAQLAWPADGLRVGLVWGGNPEQSRDRFRSMPLAALEPVLGLTGVHFYSLQVGPPAAQLQPIQDRGFPITDLGPHLHSMADTAAIIAQLDLVLTVCTSVSHLAGALGARSWVMLAHAADWRWFLDREDCPWYPTARLFRQQRRGDWAGVVERVAVELTRLRDRPVPSPAARQPEMSRA